MEPTEDWGNKSWTVDCFCGVNFDDGKEMVNYDECGVVVHTRCSRYVNSEKVFTCEKCRRKSKRGENIEDEVADSLLGMANKSGENVGSSRKTWTGRVPREERSHVQGVYKEFDWNDGNETGGNERGGNELGSEGSNGGALSLLNNYKTGGAGGSVSFGAGKRTRDEESNKKKGEEGEEVNDWSSQQNRLKKDRSSMKSIMKYSGKRKKEDSQTSEDEMVNCDECGVVVHRRCSRYVNSEKVFTCEKCRRKSKRGENIEDEVADSLLGMANKSGENVGSSRKTWTGRVPREERAHVQGVYKEFDWNDGNETGGNEGGGNELGSEGSNGGALSLLNNYKTGGAGGSVSFGAGKRTRDEESNKKKGEEGEEVNDWSSQQNRLKKDRSSMKSIMKYSGNHMEPTEDWGNKSWTVDCFCGVNFDDGKEMVNYDECGVVVHTRCSRYVNSEKVFTCEKCRRKSKRGENIEDEVADSLLGMANKSGENVGSSRKTWTGRVPREERSHVQGVYKEFDWNDGNETGGNERGGNELGSEGSNGGALSLLNNYKTGGAGGSVSFGAGKRTRDEESNKKKGEEGEEVNDWSSQQNRLKKDRSSMKSIMKYSGKRKKEDSQTSEDEMVNCDECGVVVHRRCSRYVNSEKVFTCEKCRRKSKRGENIEDEVADSLLGMANKSGENVGSSRKTWTGRVPREERAHVQGVYKEFDWNDGNETGGNEGGGNELGSEGSNGGALSLLNNYKTGGAGGSVSFGAGKRTRDEESNKKKGEEGEEVNDWSSQQNRLKKDRSSMKSIMKYSGKRKKEDSQTSEDDNIDLDKLKDSEGSVAPLVKDLQNDYGSNGKMSISCSKKNETHVDINDYVSFPRVQCSPCDEKLDGLEHGPVPQKLSDLDKHTVAADCQIYNVVATSEPVIFQTNGQLVGLENSHLVKERSSELEEVRHTREPSVSCDATFISAGQLTKDKTVVSLRKSSSTSATTLLTGTKYSDCDKTSDAQNYKVRTQQKVVSEKKTNAKKDSSAGGFVKDGERYEKSTSSAKELPKSFASSVKTSNRSKISGSSNFSKTLSQTKESVDGGIWSSRSSSKVRLPLALGMSNYEAQPRKAKARPTSSFLRAERHVFDSLKSKNSIMSDSSSDSMDHVPISSRMKKKGIKRQRTPILHARAAIEDWTDHEIILTTSQQPQGMVIPDEDASNSQGAAPSQDAYPLSVSEFERRVPDPETYLVSPQKSDSPLEHWEPSDVEVDCNWTRLGALSKAEKNAKRKKEGKLASVALDSTATDWEIQWHMKYYDMEGIWARPLRTMRPHIFNIGNQRIPRMVLTPKLISLGVGAPLHPFIKKILKWYDVAPVQLSPNSYKLVWALYIMYHNLRLGVPSMKEFSLFYSIRKSIPGYHFLVVNKWLNNKGFNEGKISHERDWKEPFFYIYDVKRTRVRFNLEPNKRTQKELTGRRKKRSVKVLQYAEKHFNLKDMITKENLKKIGALSPRVGFLCKFRDFHNGKLILTASEKSKGLQAT
ncbi:hypothetical protein AgCh_037369 [Apium graveolens]